MHPSLDATHTATAHPDPDNSIATHATIMLLPSFITPPCAHRPLRPSVTHTVSLTLPCVVRRFVLLLATIAATGSTAIPPRSTSPVVWMGDSDDLEAVTADGSMSSDSGKDDEWNRRLLSHRGAKGEGSPGKGKKGEGGKMGGSCGKGKGKKGESCEPGYTCIDGKLNGKGEDYDGTVAQTASGKTCKWWGGIEDANGNKYAYDDYGLTWAHKK